jgi:glycosyltransferase involved in cell wall biosynthesis
MYVDPQTVESIVEGTLRVLEDTQLRQLMSQRGIERSKQFSWGTTAAQMITFYEDVIRKM